MIVEAIDLTNLKTILDYYRLRKKTGTYPHGNSFLKIFESTVITFTLKDLTATDLIYLEHAGNVTVTRATVDTDLDEIKDTYDFSDEFVDHLRSYRNFIDQTNPYESLEFTGYIKGHALKYALFGYTTFDAIVYLNGTVLMQWIGTDIEKVFYSDKTNELLTDEEFYENTKPDENGFGEIQRKISVLLINGFYRYAMDQLSNEDDVVYQMLNEKYFNRVENNSASLLKIELPFGHEINFNPVGDEESGFEDGNKFLTNAKENGYEDDTTIYIGCKSSFFVFWTFMVVNHIPVVTSSIGSQLLLTNSFSLGEEMDGYQKRYQSLFQYLLSEKMNVVNDSKYEAYYKTLFCTFNTNISYCLKIRLSDVDKIKEKIDLYLEDELLERDDELIDIYKTIQTFLSYITDLFV